MSSRRELRHATRQRVIGAADRLFQERGFDVTTIRDIADASAVSVGSVMAAGDKNALLVQVFDSLIEQGHSRSVADAPRDASCAARILYLVQPFVALFAGRPDLSRIYASVQVSGRQSSPLFTRLAALLINEIGSTLTAHGCTAPDAITATSRAIYFSYIGTLFSWPAAEAIDEAELLASLDLTFTSICTCTKDAK
ncbi:TetR/AcrR family transcriptional regulator [Agreia sp.]|uniref:TetR/AcrR family transcriptional regulator n=1 Tax=Agreia sp. TaxID=1872416 RepID=UPI0035BC4223